MYFLGICFTMSTCYPLGTHLISGSHQDVWCGWTSDRGYRSFHYCLLILLLAHPIVSNQRACFFSSIAPHTWQSVNFSFCFICLYFPCSARVGSSTAVCSAEQWWMCISGSRLCSVPQPLICGHHEMSSPNHLFKYLKLEKLKLNSFPFPHPFSLVFFLVG